MDIARWGLGVDLPRAVVASGGKYVYDDDQETPNTLLARFDYGDKELVFEVRGLPTGHEADLSKTDKNCIGNLFYGSEGWMALDAEGYRIYKGEPEGELVQQAKYEEPGKPTPRLTWQIFWQLCAAENTKISMPTWISDAFPPIYAI